MENLFQQRASDIDRPPDYYEIDMHNEIVDAPGLMNENNLLKN